MFYGIILVNAEMIFSNIGKIMGHMIRFENFLKDVSENVGLNSFLKKYFSVDYIQNYYNYGYISSIL